MRNYLIHRECWSINKIAEQCKLQLKSLPIIYQIRNKDFLQQLTAQINSTFFQMELLISQLKMPEYYLDVNTSGNLQQLKKFRFGILNQAYNESQQNQEYQLQFMQLTSLLNTHLFNFQASLEHVYVSDVSDAVLSITYPPIPRITTDKLDPRKMEKILDFLKFIEANPGQHSQYSKVYFSPFTNEFYTDLLHSLISTEQTIDAIIGVFVKIQDNIITDVPYNIYIIDSLDGTVITAGIDQKLISDQKHYIYDTNVSGFDLEDWKEIQEQISNQTGKSNCHFSSQMFCRSNKLYKMDVLISMENFKQRNQTLLIVNNATYQSSLETIFEGITLLVIQDQINQLYTQLFVSGVFTFLSIIIITVMFRQLQKIIQATTRQIKMQSTHFGRELNFRSIELDKISKSKNIFNNLQQKYEDYLDKIEESKKNKSEICRLIEKFKYLQIQHSIQDQLVQGIKNNFDQILDNQQPFDIQTILLMQRILCKNDE